LSAHELRYRPVGARSWEDGFGACRMSVRAILAVWSLALVVAAGSVAVIVTSERARPVASIPFVAGVGLLFIATGLVARVRRPGNRTGVLMMLVGLPRSAAR
jgi:hypothetical protein